ncbi:hypothetical protein CA850_20125 [Micromonospora echinospora]|uniref:Uncharacterized protein n=1 Tax=Micromonospora echinospora TaxID=1877 RepID=A0A1C4XR34_MICEC|nr:hypothetical protein [Micromonospora echinospora]OZV78503.1 hypothetical protein CA850_20125 [Micromonospora echinospora]SCF10914.1 hypothetical protein GA0070618_3272 [Micromonospora echinospora]
MRQQEQQTDQTEVVRSEPVPVPSPDGTAARRGDRAGRTEVPEDALDDRGTFDDPSARRDGQGHDRATERRNDPDGVDVDRTDFHQPGPVPTAFGATTVGGAVAASALASPIPADEPDPREERTARPGDGTTGEQGSDRRADPTALLHGHHRAQTIDEAEPAGRHRGEAPGSDRTDDRRETGVRPDAATGTATATGAGAGYGSPAPAMVDPDAAPVPVSTDGAPDTLTAAGTTGSSASALAEPATLFDPGTAQGFRDRWRDVQLRFVDDPKAAAGQAQGLVEEAIHALAAALAEQKNRIGGWQDDGSADTEQLRQAVRQYRDFLDRVLGR